MKDVRTGDGALSSQGAVSTLENVIFVPGVSDS